MSILFGIFFETFECRVIAVTCLLLNNLTGEQNFSSAKSTSAGVNKSFMAFMVSVSPTQSILNRTVTSALSTFKLCGKKIGCPVLEHPSNSRRFIVTDNSPLYKS